MEEIREKLEKVDDILKRELEILEDLASKFKKFRIGKEVIETKAKNLVIKALIDVALKAHRMSMVYWKRCKSMLMCGKRPIPFDWKLYKYNSKIKEIALRCVDFIKD